MRHSIDVRLVVVNAKTWKYIKADIVSSATSHCVSVTEFHNVVSTDKCGLEGRET